MDGGRSSDIVICEAGQAPKTFPAHGASMGHWSFGIFHQGMIAPSGGFAATLFPLLSNAGGKEITSHSSFGQYNGSHFSAGIRYLIGHGLKRRSGYVAGQAI